jgi:hypothetical protein
MSQSEEGLRLQQEQQGLIQSIAVNEKLLTDMLLNVHDFPTESPDVLESVSADIVEILELISKAAAHGTTFIWPTNYDGYSTGLDMAVNPPTQNFTKASEEEISLTTQITNLMEEIQQLNRVTDVRAWAAATAVDDDTKQALRQVSQVFVERERGLQDLKVELFNLQNKTNV